MNNESIMMFHTFLALGMGWVLGTATGIIMVLKGVFNIHYERTHKK